MQPSPIGSKILSGYAVLMIGISWNFLAICAVYQGEIYTAILTVALCFAIAYYGARVFLGDYSSVRTFMALVIIYYLGVAADNFVNMDTYPADSRAAKMAVPRIIRGFLFAGVYLWYYQIRAETAKGFLQSDSSRPASSTDVADSAEELE